MVKAPVIGIDLGTTYSCVAVFQHGKVEVIANDLGLRTTPSQVAFTETERLIGEAAVIQAAMNPENTVFDVKRLIGRRFNDPCVQGDMKHWPFKVINDSGRPKIQVNFKGERKSFHPEEILSMVLSKMRETAEAYLGQPVREAVIAVPAYFNDLQRQATRDAALIAGLNVKRIIIEPTAAAVAYGLVERKWTSGGHNVLVFDLGGGTFDVSILSIRGDVFEVKATAGNTHLGGEDFNTRMVNHFVEEFRRKHNKDISNDARALRRLRSACEEAKRTLSSSTQASIGIDSLFEGIDFHTTITCAKFEELCLDLFESTLELVEKALEDAEMDQFEIDHIVLAGGSTRIPRIKELVLDFFLDKKELNESVHPDEVVAYGAAIQAAILNGDRSAAGENSLLSDVTPLSLGIETEGGKMSVLIKRNSRIPCSVTKVFTTIQNNQTTASFPVFQGECVMAKDNFKLGSLELIGLDPAPLGVTTIEITFEIDADGILKVSAFEEYSGQENEITINRHKGALSTDEIKRLVAEAEACREEDEKMKRPNAARNALKNFCHYMERKFGTDYANIKDEMSESQRDAVLERVKETLQWLDSNQLADTEEFEKKQNMLEECCENTWDLGSGIYAITERLRDCLGFFSHKEA